ncbi:MAG: dihydrodipicolinate synthase family protein [Desulfobacteraceae bacterium]|nr:dihydrodipicolinate synthase family protein [Desulfobacteraceae bacterium]
MQPPKESLKSSPQKQWARQKYKGIENLLMPSFSPDFKNLDEAGIRHDVRTGIRHGFFSVCCIPVGVTTEEHKAFLKTACEEAHGQILVGDIVAEATLAGDLAMIAFAETVGCTHLLLAPGRSLQAKSEEELYEGYLQRINATSLPIILYASVSEAYRTFGPSGVPLRIFDRLADLPNVVGIKLSQPMSLTTAFQICEVLGQRLLVGPVNLDFVPLLAKYYPVQWSGQWNVEAVQSPQKPYAVELMKHLRDQDFEGALKVYTQLEPALNAFYRLQAPLILKGLHPWVHMKYFQWCVGGNGGLIRLLPGHHGNVPVLDAAGRELIRKTYHTIGIDPVASPEEAFMVGQAAYERGVRAQELVQKPYYA